MMMAENQQLSNLRTEIVKVNKQLDDLREQYGHLFKSFNITSVDLRVAKTMIELEKALRKDAEDRLEVERALRKDVQDKLELAYETYENLIEQHQEKLDLLQDKVSMLEEENATLLLASFQNGDGDREHKKRAKSA